MTSGCFQVQHRTEKTIEYKNNETMNTKHVNAAAVSQIQARLYPASTFTASATTSIVHMRD